MSLENIGFQNVKQMTNSERLDQTQKHNQQVQIDRLLNNHDQFFTKIIQQGISIPKDLVEQITKNAGDLKKIYFGIRNILIPPGFLPFSNEKYLVLYTKSIPIVLPADFFKDDEPAIPVYSLKINLIDSKLWFSNLDNKLRESQKLKVFLALFANRDDLLTESILNAEYTTNPYLPEEALVFSLKCNLYALIIFLNANQRYFPDLERGLQEFIKFIKK